ncbi:MAG: response regulator [Elusimicrobia bacterium]|nr:response regulator [Elusimicrobiota bacterium]
MKNKAFGTYEIAKICHVTPPTVGRWIEEGKLPSFTTGGGHHRVWDRELLVFLKLHNIPVPKELLMNDGLRFLIVDDEAEVRKLVSRALRRRYPEAEIHEGVNGFDAGHKIATLLPTIVILDIRLPDFDGFQVCRVIRQDKDLRHIKILMITGDNVQETGKKVLEAGADEFLGKPFDGEELVKKVERLVNSN